MTTGSSETRSDGKKPKLLVLELWGLGDLAIATPFLRPASETFQVTLLAKPHALGLQQDFWPEVRVIPFTAPWTPFRRKYRLFSWPWKELARLCKELRAEQFDIAISARWDPREHLLLKLLGARERWGFPRLGSDILLTRSFRRLERHRHENWRALGQALHLEIPAREEIPVPPAGPGNVVLIHSGAAQVVRVWPLERFQTLANNLRGLKYPVQIACDVNQENWWREHGEHGVVVPKDPAALFALFKESALFVGNDSGPGHLAAISGVPTFTIFGPQLPELFVPLHRHAQWIEGKSCPYKPCSDYCRFAAPRCILNLEEMEVSERVEAFVKQVFASKRQVASDQGSDRPAALRD